MTLLELIRSLDTPSVESLAKRSGTSAGNVPGLKSTPAVKLN